MENGKYATGATIGSMIQKVKHFMTLSGQPIGLPFEQHTWGMVDLRIGLLASEINELSDALHDDDMNMVVDGLCDILYVAFGNMLTFIGDIDYSRGDNYLMVDTPNGKLPDYMTAHRMVTFLNEMVAFDENMGYPITSISRYDSLIRNIMQFSYNHGIDIVGAFNEVHESNMTKFCYDDTESCASILRYRENGVPTYSVYNNEYQLYVIKNSMTHKVLKGLRFREPNLRPFF